MESMGAYNRSSRVQTTGLSPAVPLLEQAAVEVSLSDDASPAISIVDYGSSQGRNSLAPMAAAIRALRSRVGLDHPISVVHTDLPDNDFTTLFSVLESDPESYLRDDPATFASAVGRSFYNQVVPSGSVTIGWSSWAVQWLSRVPLPIPDHVHASQSSDDAARVAYAQQAAADWETFLRCRSRELQPGGKLVVLTMASTDDGDFGYGEALDAMHGALMDLVDEGLVDSGEAAQMAIPTFGRTRAELLAPFGDDGEFAGLSIDHAEVFLGEDSIWSAFQEDRDAAAFGAKWAAFSRASVFPTLALALNTDPDDRRVAEFMQRMEVGMAARLSAHPSETSVPLATIAATKVDR